MIQKNNNSINICCGDGCLVAILFSWWTDRTLDYWCTYFSGHDVNIPFIFSFIINLFFSGIAMLANLVSEIVRICIGA